MQRIIFSLAIGLAGICVFLVAAKGVGPGPHWYDSVIWLVLALGSLTSGSIHGGGSDLLFFLTVLLELSGMAYLVLWGVDRFRRMREARRTTNAATDGP